MDAPLNDGAPVAVSQFGYIGISVSDMDVWREYAQAVLGFQINGESAAGEVFLRFDDYHHRFILTPGDGGDIAFQGWEVKDNAALEQMAAKLRGHGIDVVEATSGEAQRRMVHRLIKFADPDGLQTEIYYGPFIDHKPFVSPRGVKGFCAGNLGLGHMVIAVQDPQAYLRFLTEVMGAKITDYIDVNAGGRSLQLTFLRVNPRHHSIAITGRMPGPGTAVAKRLNHVMVEVRDMDDVGLAFSIVQQRGILSGGLGRHTNDKMFSFYSQTPSGFMIEYGYGGLLIEDESQWDVRIHHAPSIWGHGRPQQPRTPAE